MHRYRSVQSTCVKKRVYARVSVDWPLVVGVAVGSAFVAIQLQRGGGAADFNLIKANGVAEVEDLVAVVSYAFVAVESRCHALNCAR